MNKVLKITLLFILGLFGCASLITPAFKAVNSSSTSKIWSYSLYTRMFGGGNPKIGNTGLLTLAWVLGTVAFIITIVLIVLSFLNYEVSKKSLIITFAVIMVLYAISGTLVIFTPNFIGNTSDSTLGLGSILTSCSMYAGFILSLIFFLYNLFTNEE